MNSLKQQFMDAANSIIEQNVKAMADSITLHMQHQLISDAPSAGLYRLAEELRNVRGEVAKQDDTHYTVEFSFDHISDEARDLFEFYLPDAQKMALA